MVVELFRYRIVKDLPVCDNYTNGIVDNNEQKNKIKTWNIHIVSNCNESSE